MIVGDFIERWQLEPAGEPFRTPTSELLPVLWNGRPAMLKLAANEDEAEGGALMEWWAGDGAARVYRREGAALLMERATGGMSLVTMAQQGEDDAATRILCGVLGKLHHPRPDPPVNCVALSDWFSALWPAAEQRGGIFAAGAESARRLLDAPQDVVILHGDIHHDNVLDFAGRGWLAIDPKRLIGERGFDYANIFTNPDLDHPEPPVAVRRDRFDRRLDVVCGESGLERTRQLHWILAWATLSAVWFLDDDMPADIDLTVAGFALDAL